MHDARNAVLTAEGRRKAEEELNILKSDRRKEVSEKIRIAKEMGDLSENAEYASAKEEQAFIESRILELEQLLKFAKLAPADSTADSAVHIGSIVTVNNNGQEKKYQIVGYNEADPAHGKISNESPIGQALLNHIVGDEVVYKTPAGERHLVIKVIE